MTEAGDTGAAAMAMRAGGWGFKSTDFVIDGARGGGSSVGGGGFTMSREEAQAALEDARGIADELAAQARDALRLLQTGAPANDPASESFNKVGLDAFSSGAQHVAAERDYWNSLVTALEKALGIYQESDEQAGADIGKSAGQDSSGGGYI